MLMSRKNRKDMTGVLGHFLQQYKRKAQPGAEPNDRQYGEDDDRLDKSST
jgi:hypothetical protein